MTVETIARDDGGRTAPRKRPLTGAEYLESLRDGREIWIYGARVKDVTTHPAFRNTVRMIARLYDALHDPARKDILTTETDTGSGGYTHRFYKGSRNAGELVAARDAIAEWARVSYGWIGRSPDYKAAFLATLGANSATTSHSRKTPNAGTRKFRKKSPSSITPSSTRRWIATSRSTK